MNSMVEKTEGHIPYPSAKFIVLADIHYYDLALGTTGDAFEKIVNQSKEIKMVKEIPEILEAAIEEIEQEEVDFVLVCGDLTREGEYSSHTRLAKALKKLTTGGRKVFVINGNHDIQNPLASRFYGEVRERTASVSASDFETIYSDLGYGEALERDENSLSYLAEPVEGLWLLAIDSCRWKEEFSEAGGIYPRTLEWIKKVLARAKEQKKAVIAMMHHGLLEHYRGNKKFYGSYIIEDNEKISSLLMEHGVNVVFTGHFHSQDIALKKAQGNYLYDIETGSLVTYPCPFRIVTIDSNQRMEIRSKSITATATHTTFFLEHAFAQSYNAAEQLAMKTLKKWWISQKDAELLAPQIVNAFTAHGTGNEEKPGDILNLQGVGLWGRIVMLFKKPLLEGLWEQSPPPDNNLSIDLETGSYQAMR